MSVPRPVAQRIAKPLAIKAESRSAVARSQAVAPGLSNYFTAIVASFTHLFMKLVLAAPPSFFSVACVLQAGLANAEVLANSVIANATRRLFMACPFTWSD